MFKIGDRVEYYNNIHDWSEDEFVRLGGVYVIGNISSGKEGWLYFTQDLDCGYDPACFRLYSWVLEDDALFKQIENL